MNTSLKSLLIATLVSTSVVSLAGNTERSGQAGASELLINPWSRTSGMSGSNGASVKGLEAQYLNVAGLAFTKKTELLFSRTNYLVAADIHINAFGFSQKVGSSGVMGVSIMSMNYGDIDITTTDNPEGGIGKYSPNATNINLSYAKEFSNSIYGGVNIKVISERNATVAARSVAIDAGVQYLTGNNAEKNNVHFGISLKNVGAPMKFGGNGLSYKVAHPNDPSYQLTMEQRAAQFELPSLLNISGAYDFRLMAVHRISPAVTFVSNSFGKNQFNIGVEYGFKTYLMVRAGYLYEKGIASKDNTTNILSGPSAGLTFEVPVNSKGTSFGVDYSFRATRALGGIHSFGLRFTL